MQHDIGDNNIVTKRNTTAGYLNGAVEAWAEWLFDGERRLRNEIFFIFAFRFGPIRMFCGALGGNVRALRKRACMQRCDEEIYMSRPRRDVCDNVITICNRI